MQIVGILVLILAVLVIVVGILGWTQRLPGNSYIGLRIPEVRKSREMWQLAHKMAGPIWVTGGIAAFFASLLLFTDSGWLWLLAGVLFVIALVFVSLGASAGARAVSIVSAQEDNDSGSCCSSGSSETAAQQPAATPEVDIAALRRAAQSKNS